MSSSASRGKIELTLEEISYTLRHSALPTIIIEGKDDTIVFRPLEERFGAERISIFPVGGRTKLLALFEELGTNPQFLFIADRDQWCVDPIPEKYMSSRMLFTDGYSIENDAMRDGDMLALLRYSERAKFEQELDIFLNWYALAFNRVLQGNDEAIRTHCATIIDEVEQRNSLMQLKPGEQYPEELKEKLAAEYLRLVRGKSLIHLLVRQISYPGRVPRHHHAALLEQVAVKPGPLLAKFYQAVEELLLGSILTLPESAS
ncbi:hypothetical protein ACI2J4_06005 [Agrobacterium tumefaciens]|uniref:hypothetical protein n=1 Tax=Agrobacterium tumefaciens TaxID=358 RepID=UPI00384D2C61